MAVLTFWARKLSDVGADLCIVECLGASLASIYWKLVAPTPSCDNQKYLQILSIVS